jgi:benzodiazapine receptor
MYLKSRFIVFLLLNFAALGIGGFLLGNPATNVWYQHLNKAPWTPPGWVFGVAWFSIMFFYAVFMYNSTKGVSFSGNKLIYSMFLLQWLLNVAWNPLFFRLHWVGMSLIVIILLTAVVGYFAWYGFRNFSFKGFLMLPYLFWLLIAISLNFFVLANN